MIGYLFLQQQSSNFETILLCYYILGMSDIYAFSSFMKLATLSAHASMSASGASKWSPPEEGIFEALTQIAG